MSNEPNIASADDCITAAADQLTALAAKVAELQTCRTNLMEHRDRFMGERDALAAENARLREEARPFAMLGGCAEHGIMAYPDLDSDVVVYKNSGHAITAGDVRRLRAALAPPAEPTRNE